MVRLPALCVAAVLLAVPAIAAPPPMATVDAFHAALGRGDTDAAMAQLADGVLIFEEGGAEASRAEYATHHLAADAAYAAATRATTTRRTVRIQGKLAWVASEGRVTGAYRGKPVDRLTAETMILTRAGAAWRIAHIHWSSRVPPGKAN